MNNPSPRQAAAGILTQVEAEKAYANLLLQNRLAHYPEARDRQFITMLVNGVLKHRLTLDFALRLHLSKPLSSLPHQVRSILRIGAWQVLFMEKTPTAVAVNEAVELTKGSQHKFSALVNSVLRQVSARGWDLPWPDPKREPVRYLSVRYSHPEWLVRRWWKRWGFDETQALCQADNEPAPTWIRTNTLKVSRLELEQRLEEEGVETELGARVPESLIIREFGAVEKLQSFQEGLFTVQDESSQLVAHVLSPVPGEHVLDACSAPGGKTTHLAQLMDNKGLILAFDVHSHKLNLIEGLADRLGVSIIEPHLGDARALPGVKPLSQERVLVDAPCSGLGVIRRKADLRWQKEDQDLQELPVLQLAILEKAAECVALGGELLYSTCTVEPEENFEVAKSFRQAHPEFEPVDLREGLPFTLTEEQDARQAAKGMLQLLPHRHGMDGFFLAKFRRTQV